MDLNQLIGKNKREKKDKDKRCRVCQNKPEDIDQILVSKMARKEIRGVWVEEVDEKLREVKGHHLTQKMAELLIEKPRRGMSEYLRMFENVAQ